MSTKEKWVYNFEGEEAKYVKLICHLWTVNSMQGLQVTFAMCHKIFISVKLNIQAAAKFLINYTFDQWGALWSCFLKTFWPKSSILNLQLLNVGLAEKEGLIFLLLLSLLPKYFGSNLLADLNLANV